MMMRGVAMVGYVFDSKHDLAHGIRWPDQLRAKLESCRDRATQVKGGQGGGLRTILKHLPAAKQRPESVAPPEMRYWMLLSAVAL